MKTLAELTEAGIFLAPEPKKATVTFTIGDTDYTADVYIKRTSVAEQEKLFGNLGATDDTRHAHAALICTFVRLGENGEESIPMDKALLMHSAMGNALVAKIREVNGQLEKNLPPPSDSATT